MSALDSSITLDDVFSVVTNKRVPLAPELAGYLVLEIAEHADPVGGDVDPKSVFVSEEGTVALVKPKRDGATGDAEASIRTALARLLEASGSQTPALSAACKRKSGTGLPSLAEELEAALIPVNRAAGRRALARLAREVKRVTLGVGRNALPSTSDGAASSRRLAPAAPVSTDSVREAAAPPPSRGAAVSFSLIEEPTTTRGQIPDEVLLKATPEPAESSEMPTTQFELTTRTPSPSQADVDDLIAQFGVSGSNEQQHARDLKVMVGLEPTPPPPQQAVRRIDTREIAAPAGADSDVDSLLSMDADARVAKERGATPVPPRSSARSPVAKRDERQLPTQPSSLRKTRASSPSQANLKKKKRGSGLVVVLALLFVVLGGLAVWELRPGPIAGRTPVAATPASVVPSAPANLGCKATLIVDDVPAQAEVLLRTGQAPIDVPDMPVGARLEFVATAEGYAPKRVVVPAGATWDPGPDQKPRFEAGVQLEKSKVRSGTNDPWPPAEPGSEAGGQGPPGTVHVVATPRGAEIWMLVGLGPEARVEQLHCGQDFDVLVAGPKTFRKRTHVAASDFVDDTKPPSGAKPKVPTRVAHVSAK